MKCLMVIVALAGVALGFGQTKSDPSLFSSVRPLASISVAPHPTGAQLVEIVLLDPKYPAAVLSKQIERLGEDVHSPINGLRMYTDDFGGDPSNGLPKATFGIRGLIDSATGELRLAPIVRAMTGAPEPHALTGLNIVFQNQVPRANTIDHFRSPNVEVESDAHPGSIGIEYRVKLLTQDPSKIDIPEGLPKPLPPPTKASTSGIDWTFWGLIAIAAVASGALVYFALSRPRSA